MVRSKNPELHESSSSTPLSSSSTSSSSAETPTPTASLPLTSSSTPTPPPKPKSIQKKTPTPKKHPRPKVKIVEPPTKKAKGISIKEPIVTRSKSKEVSGSGKEKVTEASSDSSSDDSFARAMKQAIKQSKKEYLGHKSSGQPSAGPSVQATSQSEAASASQAPENEDFEPPEDFIVKEVKAKIQKVYDTEFDHRSFCPVVYVDLDYLKKQCGLDFHDFLDWYEPWLSVHLPYSPKVVKTFYANMKVKNVKTKKGELIEEGMSTSIRGEDIHITASSINRLLGYLAPPEDPDYPSTNETFRLLRPGAEIGPLTFKPVEMPDAHRALFYIYSRSMINKSKNFTHFANRDYYFMASLLAQQRRNVGSMIFDEMRRFRFSSTRTTTIPYPQLVSLILQHHKVWYLDGKEKVSIPRFGRTQLSHMGISIPISKASSKEPATSKGDEAQSSARGRSPSPPPSFFGASVQGYVSEAISKALLDLKKEMIAEYNKLTNKMEFQVKKLVENANHNFDLIFKEQQEQTKRLAELENYLHVHLSPTQPSSPPVPPSSTPVSQPSEDVIFTFTDPLTAAQVDITLSQPSSPAPQPFSPPFASAPIDPITAIVPYIPPSSSDPISFPQPPLHDADKTGEKKK